MKSLHTLLILCLFLFSASASAQYDVSKINKKALAAYNQALELAQNGQYNQSISALQQAIQHDSKYIDAYLSLAGVYGQLKNHEQSVAAYEKAFPLDTAYTAEYKLPYAINLAGMGQFSKALQTIDALLAKEKLAPNTRKAAEYRKKTFEFAVDFAAKSGDSNYVFTPKNIGDGINSRFSEYWPSMTVEGEQMVFTRREGDNEDFFLSERNGTAWEPARRLTGSINTPQNEGAQIISQDGQWLVFAGNNRPGGFGNFDIYISYKTPEGWSSAINLGGVVNSEYWDSQPCLSPDKRQLFFASNRPGGLGGSDIYVSEMQPNGKWSEPQNMGPGINTAGEEACPFLHADNQTFYFTSNGWPGYGDEDIFMVRKGGDSKWGTPENIGYPINTIHREGTLFIEANAETAYYASDRGDSKGGLDIYSFTMPAPTRPAKTLWVKGKVFDNKTGGGLPSAVELIDLSTGAPLSRVQTDETGNYLVTLPVGKDYAFNVSRKGYLFYSDNYTLSGKAPDSIYKKDIPLQPLELAAAMVLKNIFFDVAQFNLKSSSQIELDRVVQLLKDNPTVKIQIGGHTDNVGKPADNLKLSQDRANAVVKYLVGKGIAATRLTAKGFGETVPVVPNTNDEARAQNRRTELKITAL